MLKPNELLIELYKKNHGSTFATYEREQSRYVPRHFKIWRPSTNRCKMNSSVQYCVLYETSEFKVIYSPRAWHLNNWRGNLKLLFAVSTVPILLNVGSVGSFYFQSGRIHLLYEFIIISSLHKCARPLVLQMGMASLKRVKYCNAWLRSSILDKGWTERRLRTRRSTIYPWLLLILRFRSD